MSRPFRSDRSWTFSVPAATLWDRIAATQEYTRMWPWLRAFDGSAGLAGGARWHCEVAPPLPYIVRFTIDFSEVSPAESARTTIEGDIRGWADLRLSPTDGGCIARLKSELEPANALLRGFGRVARPMIEWGHDWILDQGQHQFLERGGL